MQRVNARYVVLCQAQAIRLEPPLLTLTDPSMAGAWRRLCPQVRDREMFLFRVTIRQGYADPSELVLF